MTLLDAALSYAARGWRVFPCHYVTDGVCSCGKPGCAWPTTGNAGKHPATRNGYQDATTDADQIRLWWERTPRANIGVACAPSRLLVIDVDPRHGGDESMRRLESDLGALPGPRVITGSGGWHIYTVAPVGSPRGAVANASGVDVKYNGYVIAPPSVHPCGEPYRWDRCGDPAEIPEAWLPHILHAPRAARPKRKYDAGELNADELEDALSCIPAGDYDLWIRIGMSIKAAVGDSGISIWDAWSSTAHNYDADCIPGHWRSFREDGAITKATVFGVARDHGWRPPLRLVDSTFDVEDVPPPTDDDAPEWLHADADTIDIGPTVSDNKDLRAEIRITTDIKDVVDRAEVAILEMPRRNLYQRSGALVRVVRDAAPVSPGQTRPPGAVTIKSCSVSHLQELCSRAATWWGFDARKKEWIQRIPPIWAVSCLQERGQWRFPPLTGIIAAPTIRPDGSVLDTPGYDAATGLLYMPGRVHFPRVPDAPTRMEAREALERLSEPFLDFPFQDRCDLSAALAAVLSIVCRAAISGPVPMFAIRATTAGTGKGLLADVASIIGTGRPAAKWAQSQTEDEERKRLLSVALEGDPVICIDNVSSTLGSGALDGAITSGSIKDRLLGGNATAEALWRVVVLATGNNIQIRGDLGRRIIPIDMDARCERPELRGGWRHPDLLGWVAEHRPLLVVDALTAVRAYALAGWPPMDVPPIGSFEAFGQVVRGAIIWSGLPDPAEGRERMRAESSPELETLGAVVAAWHDHYGADGRVVRDVVEEVWESPHGGSGHRLRMALEDAIAGRSKGTTATRVGYYLRRNRGRVVTGLQLQSGSKTPSGIMWCVVAVASA